MATLSRMVGFVQTAEPEKAKAFYGGVLGFRLVEDDQYALVYDANGTFLRVAKGMDGPPAGHTVLGWQVEDIQAAVHELEARGVRFVQWKMDFMQQDAHGIWLPGNGDAVAWFKDPDGNVLSLSQHARK